MHYRWDFPEQNLEFLRFYFHSGDETVPGNRKAEQSRGLALTHQVPGDRDSLGRNTIKDSFKLHVTDLIKRFVDPGLHHLRPAIGTQIKLVRVSRR
jgi:hypothetical protein